MSIIKVLDPSLSNKIAAGEVVERPASVVKELLENSIDAKSSEIIIKIKDAGKKEIMISDNGIGMDKEDATLAFARHATSKLSTDRDLFRIATLGFRGEALASIASVSDIELDTSKENEIGTHVEIINGKISKVNPAGVNKGTTIKVKNLFFNTPARLKFLKSDNVEFSHISDVVMKMALAYPRISFTLYNEDKISFYSAGKGNILEMVSSMYGIDVAKNMNKFEASNDDFQISGYTSSIGVSRSNKSGIITILNGRCVRLIGAISAIIDSYKTYLSDDRYPITVINIETDYNLVDVNVHPSKQEVRLSKENELKELITQAISEIFMIKNIAPRIVHNDIETKSEQVSFNLDTFPSYYQTYNSNLEVNENLVSEPSIQYENKEDSISYSRLTPIGQYIGKYILASDGESLYIVDQHAAAERINYEKFTAKYNNMSNWSYTDLLVPIVITLTKKEAAILLENLELMKQIGIDIESFGESSFRVTSVPTWFKEVDSTDYLNEIIEQVVSSSKISLVDLRLHVISTLACKASLKANRVLSSLEMHVLLQDLLKCQNPYTCPHGRPTTIIYSTNELDKLFKRV